MFVLGEKQQEKYLFSPEIDFSSNIIKMKIANSTNKNKDKNINNIITLINPYIIIRLINITVWL